MLRLSIQENSAKLYFCLFSLLSASSELDFSPLERRDSDRDPSENDCLKSTKKNPNLQGPVFVRCKRRWSRRGLVSHFAALCVWKAHTPHTLHMLKCSCRNAWAVLWVWLRADGLMARSNNQSLDIRFRFFSAPWKTRCKPLLYLCHNDCLIMCEVLRKDFVVI